MSDRETFDTIQACVADSLALDLDEVTLTSRLSPDLGADSLDLVDMIFMLEKAFGVKIREGELSFLSKLDISSQEVEKYTYRFIREEAFDGRNHFVIERDPVDPKSGYSRQVAWVDTEHYRVWKVEFFARGGSLLKTLSVSDYNLYLDKYHDSGR